MVSTYWKPELHAGEDNGDMIWEIQRTYPVVLAGHRLAGNGVDKKKNDLSILANTAKNEDRIKRKRMKLIGSK